MAQRLAAAAACLLTAGAAMGQVTAAGIAPTADQLGAGEAEFSQWWTSETNRLKDRWLGGGQLLVGVHSRIEFGIGTDYLSDPTLGMKLNLWRSKDEAWGLAAGFTGVKQNLRPTYFAAAGFARDAWSIHGGVQAFNGEEQGFAVAMVGIGDRLTLGVDHIFGRYGLTAATAWIDLGSGFCVYGTGYFPNDRTAQQTACFGFAYGFKL